jgi:hypothetical protein
MPLGDPSQFGISVLYNFVPKKNKISLTLSRHLYFRVETRCPSKNKPWKLNCLTGQVS